MPKNDPKTTSQGEKQALKQSCLYHKRFQTCIGSSSGGHMLRGIVTQDVSHASSCFAHQAGTQVDGVAKDSVLGTNAGADTGTQQLPCGDPDAALAPCCLHALHNAQCCLHPLARPEPRCARLGTTVSMITTFCYNTREDCPESSASAVDAVTSMCTYLIHCILQPFMR